MSHVSRPTALPSVNWPRLGHKLPIPNESPSCCNPMVTSSPRLLLGLEPPPPSSQRAQARASRQTKEHGSPVGFEWACLVASSLDCSDAKNKKTCHIHIHIHTLSLTSILPTTRSFPFPPLLACLGYGPTKSELFVFFLFHHFPCQTSRASRRR